MCGEHDRKAVRHIVQILHEDRAAGLQALDHEAVVDDLVADIDRAAEFLQRPLDDLDRAFDAGTEAARIGQHGCAGPAASPAAAAFCGLRAGFARLPGLVPAESIA